MEDKFYSLLYLDENSRETETVMPAYITENIGFNDVKPWFYNTIRYRERLKLQLDKLLIDGNSIRYRQEILSDFISSTELKEAIHYFLPMLFHLKNEYNEYIIMNNDRIRDTLWKVDIFESYAACIGALNDILTTYQNSYSSKGFILLRKYITDVLGNHLFKAGIRALENVREKMTEIRSVSVNIRFNGLYEPVQANMKTLKSQASIKKLLCELFGTDEEDDSLYFSLMRNPVIGIQSVYGGKYIGQIDDIMKAAIPVMDAYNATDIERLIDLDFEFDYYLAAVRFINKCKDIGVKMCLPVCCPKDDNVCIVEDAIDLGLAARMTGEKDDASGIVPNTIRLDDSARIYILTGANAGGKTTYLRSIGITYMLFLNGLYVPGSVGRISPVCNLFIHFPQEEEKVAGEGRLGEELAALRNILDKIVKGDVILLNESLSGTSMSESATICADFLSILSEMGVKCVFATHLHSLSDHMEEMNRKENILSRMASLVAVVEEVRQNNQVIGRKRTYRIERRKPDGESYANDIAYTRCISYEQIMASRHNEREE